MSEPPSQTTTDRLSTPLGELVAADGRRAALFDRLGLDYCCGGDRTLEEACRARGLDPSTVIAALDALESAGDSRSPETDWRERPLTDLIDHIIDEHHGYLRRELPELGALLDRVAKVHGDQSEWLHEAREVFGRLRREISDHTEREERTIFPEIRALAAGERPADAVDADALALLDEAEDEHDETGAALRRLRDLSDGYAAPEWACSSFRRLLDGLETLQSDTHRHIHEENSILFPRARRLARERPSRGD